MKTYAHKNYTDWFIRLQSSFSHKKTILQIIVKKKIFVGNIALKHASLVLVVIAPRLSRVEKARAGYVLFFKATHSNENVCTQKLNRTIHISSNFISMPKPILYIIAKKYLGWEHSPQTAFTCTCSSSNVFLFKATHSYENVCTQE